MIFDDDDDDLDISVLDAIEVQYLAQRGTCSGSGTGNGPQTQHCGGYTAPHPVSSHLTLQLSAAANAPSLQQPAQQSGWPGALQTASTRPASAWERAVGQHPQYPCTAQPRWQQPKGSTHDAAIVGNRGAHSLSGHGPPPSMKAASQQRPSVHEYHQQQPQQHRHSASAHHSAPAQDCSETSTAQHGCVSAAGAASTWGRAPSQPSMSRQAMGTQNPPRALWEPGGQQAVSSAMLALPVNSSQRWLQDRTHAGPSLENGARAKPPQGAAIPLSTAQPTASQVQLQRPLHAVPAAPGRPSHEQFSPGVLAAAENVGQHEKRHDRGHPPMHIGGLPQVSSAAATLGVQTPEHRSIGDSDALIRAPAASHQEPVSGPAGGFSIEWDDWHPVEDWAMDPMEPSQPVPAAEGPAVALEQALESTVDDVKPAHASGSEPELVLCKTATKGMLLDRFAARTWVYPAGIAERDYQVAIVEEALLHNTLVCLPTGLGKTFIAAVVMYNFFRWFPEGKVVFLAPTKPLVHQQMDACQHFMGSAKVNSIVLDGSVSKEERVNHWTSEHRRIIFATPQAFKNDVFKGICPSEKITCVIVDECHRAVGKNDAVSAISKMHQDHYKFRVIGLSATPGSRREAVQEVVSNLMISRIEVRGEEDADVAKYRHAIAREVRVVRPSQEVDAARHMLMHSFRRIMNQLAHSKAYYGKLDAETVTRYGLQCAMNNYQSSNRSRDIFMVFKQGMLLADLRDQLDLHGINQAQQYLQEKLSGNGSAPVKRLISTDPSFKEFQVRLDNLVQTSATHPKMAALLDIVREHFKQHAASGEAEDVSRIIIFTALRETVHSICEALRQHEPFTQAKMFIGQGAGSKKGGGGMPQREQKAVLADFRKGNFNTLVATCIGEEGLDIPQVDMVVCYDAHASPIRDMQRCGRTGRHRNGRVVQLLALGKEEASYEKQQMAAAELQCQLRQQEFELYSPNPRMLPAEYRPRKLHAEILTESPEKQQAQKGKRKGARTGGAKGKKARGKAAEGGSRPAAQAKQPAAEHEQLPAPRCLSLRERMASAAQPAAELIHTAWPHDLKRQAMQSRGIPAGVALPCRAPSPVPAADAPLEAAVGDVGIVPEGTAEHQDAPHLLDDDAQQPHSAGQVPGCAEAGRAQRKRKILVRCFMGTSEPPDGVQDLDVENSDDLLEELPCCQRAAALPTDRLKPSPEVAPPVEGRDASLSPGRSRPSAETALHKQSIMPDEACNYHQRGSVHPADMQLQQEQTAHASNGGRGTYDAEALDMRQHRDSWSAKPAPSGGLAVVPERAASPAEQCADGGACWDKAAPAHIMMHSEAAKAEIQPALVGGSRSRSGQGDNAVKQGRQSPDHAVRSGSASVAAPSSKLAQKLRRKPKQPSAKLPVKPAQAPAPAVVPSLSLAQRMRLAQAERDPMHVNMALQLTDCAPRHSATPAVEGILPHDKLPTDTAQVGDAEEHTFMGRQDASGHTAGSEQSQPEILRDQMHLSQLPLKQRLLSIAAGGQHHAPVMAAGSRLQQQSVASLVVHPPEQQQNAGIWHSEAAAGLSMQKQVDTAANGEPSDQPLIERVQSRMQQVPSEAAVQPRQAPPKSGKNITEAALSQQPLLHCLKSMSRSPEAKSDTEDTPESLQRQAPPTPTEGVHPIALSQQPLLQRLNSKSRSPNAKPGTAGNGELPQEEAPTTISEDVCKVVPSQEPLAQHLQRKSGSPDAGPRTDASPEVLQRQAPPAVGDDGCEVMPSQEPLLQCLKRKYMSPPAIPDSPELLQRHAPSTCCEDVCDTPQEALAQRLKRHSRSPGAEPETGAQPEAKERGHRLMTPVPQDPKQVNTDVVRHQVVPDSAPAEHEDWEDFQEQLQTPFVPSSAKRVASVAQSAKSAAVHDESTGLQWRRPKPRRYVLQGSSEKSPHRLKHSRDPQQSDWDDFQPAVQGAAHVLGTPVVTCASSAAAAPAGDASTGLQFRRPLARRPQKALTLCTPGLQTVSKKRASSPEARAARTSLKRLRKEHAARTPDQPAIKMPGQPAKQGIMRDADQRIRARQQAAAFIDGEADVSGDDEGSSDEDAEGADEELSGLIDDATQQPGSVQPRRQSDMLAVYRNSLLMKTPTPLRQRINRWLPRESRTQQTPAGTSPGSPLTMRLPLQSQYDFSDSFIATESQVSEHLTSQNDEFCNLCRKEGELLCCDGCPAAFHLSCLGMQSAPAGEWYCAVCQDA